MTRWRLSIWIARAVIAALVLWWLGFFQPADICPLVAFFWADCPCCACTEDCTWCTSELGPCEFDVTLSGFDEEFCGDLNDTFTLSFFPPQQDQDFTVSGSDCVVEETVIEEGCWWNFGEILGANLGLIISENHIYLFLFDFDGSLFWVTWKDAITTPFDCRNVVNLAVPVECTDAFFCTTAEDAIVNTAS